MTPTGSSLGASIRHGSHCSTPRAGTSAATSRPRKRSCTPPCTPSGRLRARSCICIPIIRLPSAVCMASIPRTCCRRSRRIRSCGSVRSRSRLISRRATKSSPMRWALGRPPSRDPARQSWPRCRRCNAGRGDRCDRRTGGTARLFLLLRREAINPLTGRRRLSN